MATTSNNNLQQAAENYVLAGFKVIPLCSPDENGNCGCGCGHTGRDIGKAPLTAHGLKDATGTLFGIREYWSRWPSANIGIVTDGLAVLDIDKDRKGYESKAAIEKKFGALPPTLVNSTGGGGEHHIYRSNGSHIKNAVNLGG